MGTKYCMVAHTAYGFSVWNLVHVILLALKSFEVVSEFWESLYTPHIKAEYYRIYQILKTDCPNVHCKICENKNCEIQIVSVCVCV